MTYSSEVRLRDVRKLEWSARSNFVVGMLAFAVVGVIAASGELATIPDAVLFTAVVGLGLANFKLVDRALREVSA